MEKSRLTYAYSLSDGSNFVDRIHQSLIEIENEHPTEEEVHQLLMEAITYLDKDLTINTANELFSLILSCFSHYTNQLLPLFNKLLETSTKNSYHIIITASVLSYLARTQPQLSLTDYNSFVDDSLAQILSQLQKNDEKGLKIFDHEILPQYQHDLIINLLLSTKLTKSLVSSFSPYLFSPNLIKNNSKLDLLIDLISKDRFVLDIPQNILPNILSDNDFSIESIAKYIPYLSEQTFKSILPRIEQKILNSKRLHPTFSKAILIKCSEIGVKVKNIEKLIESLSKTDLTPQILDYLKKYKNLNDHKISDEKFNDIPTIENLTEDTINQKLLEINDLQVYLNVFPMIKTRHPFLSSSEFWVHICSLAAHSKVSISRKMANQFHFYFERFVDERRFNSVLNSMIFSNETKTSFGMEFITQLIFNPKPFVKQNYLGNVQLNELMFKVLQTNIILSPCFWRLFSKNLIYREYQQNKLTVLLYGYEFAIGKSEHEFKSLTIQPQTEESKQDILEYLQKVENKRGTKYEVKENMNEKAVSLIGSAFLFTRKEGNIYVEGLTVDTILPFIAIVFDQSNRLCNLELRNEVLVNILNYFKIGQNFALFKHALKSLENNRSPLLLESIDHLLPYFYSLLDPQFFSFRVCLTTVKILIQLLLNENYLANKMSLLSTIFQFSNGDHELNKERKIEDDSPINSDLLLLFKIISIQLFEYIMKNLSEIVHFNEFKSKLNLAVFDDSISSFIINYIQDSKNLNDSILLIQFVESFCINVPVFKFENTQIFNELIQKAVDEKMTTESSLIYQFMLKNDIVIDLHHLIEQPFLLSNLQQDTTKLVLKKTFDYLMVDESISTDYLAILLQKEVSKESRNNFDFDFIFKFYSKESQKYEKSFVDAVHRLFAFDQNKNKFILKPELNYLSSQIQSEIGSSLISGLFSVINENDDQFNAFVLLKNIACWFPFLFVDRSKQIFEAVLHAIEKFTFSFKTKDEARSKTAISALSFLFSTLNLPAVADNFVDWMLENIKAFNEFQIFSFVVFLRSLICSDMTKNVLISKLIKLDFIEVVTSILKRDFKEDGKFHENFLNEIFKLIEKFFFSLRCLTTKDLIFINELMNVEKPFQVIFGHSMVMREQFSLSSSSLLKNINDEMIIDFAREIESTNYFELKQSTEEEMNGEQITEFHSIFSSQSVESHESMNEIHQKIPQPLTEKMIGYLLSKPSWILKWIESPHNFLLISEHIELLNKTIIELQEKDDELSQQTDLTQINKNKKDELFDALMSKTTTIMNSSSLNDVQPSSFCELFTEIRQNKEDLISILKSVTKCLKNASSLNSIQGVVDALTIISKSCDFKENFIEICGNVLLEAVLTPNFRRQSDLFIKIANLFIRCDDVKLPNRIVHFIGFMLLLNDTRIVQPAAEIYGRLDESSQKFLAPFVQSMLDKAAKEESSMVSCVPEILKRFPSIAKSSTKQLLELLDRLLDRFSKERDAIEIENKEIETNKDSNSSTKAKKENEPTNSSSTTSKESDTKNSKASKDDKSCVFVVVGNGDIESKCGELLGLIGAVLAVVAPQRNLSHSIKQSPSIDSEIPAPIFESSPDFWRVFTKHRRLITETVQQRPNLLGTTFNFLLNFPELLEFNIRYSYFKLISSQASTDSILELTVRSTNILTDSFNLLNPLPTADFMRQLRVMFHSEKEKVQSDIYYQALIKELFDPRNYFFVYTENRKSFQINPRSDVIRKHLEYFKFAGKIIARNIIENRTLGINLTPCIYKMILKRPLEIEDLKEVDFELFTSLQQKLDEANLSDDSKSGKSAGKKDDDAVFFTLDFACDEEEEEEEAMDEISYDQITTENQKVNRNQMYVDSKVEHRLRGQITDQVNAFCDGFYSIIPFDVVKSLLPSELTYLIHGVPQIDCEELLKNIEIVKPFTRESPTVKAFFAAVRQWDQEKLLQLLLFITKSTRATLSGFECLKKEGNPIKIAPGDGIDLPHVHQYVHLLLLPECDDQNLMNWKFLVVFNEMETNASSARKVVKIRYKKKNVKSTND